MLGIESLIIIVLIYWLWKIWFKEFNEPCCYPRGLPAVTQAFALIGDGISAWHLTKVLARHCYLLGGVMTAKIGFRKIYVITDPEVFTVISSKCSKTEKSNIFNKPWIDKNTATLTLKDKYKNLISPTLSQVSINLHMNIFNRQSRKLIKTLDSTVDRQSLEHLTFLKLHALETLTYTNLGLNLESMLNNKNLTSAHPIFSLKDSVTFFYSCSWKLKKKEDLYHKILHISSFAALKRRRKSDLSIDRTTPANLQPLRLILQQSLKSKHLNNQELKEISEQLVAMIKHGSEVVAATLLFTMVLIGAHVEVQDKIVLELQEVFSKSDIEVQNNDILKLKYLDAVLKESMRLYSVLPVLARRIDKDLQLKNCTLRAGKSCYFAMRDHHDPLLWGVDVNEFKPERWLSEIVKPHNLLAFGLGSTACIGYEYAFTLMKTTLAHMLHTYHISTDHKPLKLKLGDILTPASGHLIRISRRSL